MTDRYVLSPRAKSDIEDIWNYTENHWGFDQAERYVSELWRHIDIMAAHPAMGRHVPS